MKRLVILEDERNIRTVLRMYLEPEGFVVEEYADPLIALPKLTSDPPDILILDGHMRGMHGIEVYLEFRKVSRAPVIFISANAEIIEDRLRDSGMPATAYVSKPFALRSMIKLVKATANQ